MKDITGSVLLRTNIDLGQGDPYQLRKVHEGKVRDTYVSDVTGDRLVVTTDRVSAFDRVLPFGVPQKGAILNMISTLFMKKAVNIVPSWVHQDGKPHPQVSIGLDCVPFKIEMIVRGYLCGSAWRAYKKGVRTICGVELPDGLVENQQLPTPIITPTTKADIGKHDEDITPSAIVASGLCTHEQYKEMADISRKLFQMGSEESEKAVMILVDTKFEFGMFNERIHLIDELLTPDSSRFFDRHYYDIRQEKGEPQEDLSKEYLRKLLMLRGFSGKEGQEVPLISEKEIREVSLRYQSVYERFMGRPLFPMAEENPLVHFNSSPDEDAIKDSFNRWFKEHRSGQ